MRSERNQDLCLRIGVKQGGCSGMSYAMDFEDRANTRPDDSIIEYKGFVIGMTSYSISYSLVTILIHRAFSLSFISHALATSNICGFKCNTGSSIDENLDYGFMQWGFCFNVGIYLYISGLRLLVCINITLYTKFLVLFLTRGKDSTKVQLYQTSTSMVIFRPCLD